MIQFVSKANLVHKNKYQYLQIEYKNQKSRIQITCPEHGIFEQTAVSHLQGRGCPKCAVNSRKATHNRQSKDTFQKKARTKYGNLYDYSAVKWKDRHTPVSISCKQHGIFDQKPAYHLSKNCPGCPSCANDKRQNEAFDAFKKQAFKIHNGIYDYSACEYKNSEDKIRIGCQVHGEFWQTPHNHLAGQGCPKCGASSSVVNRTKSQDEFIKQAEQVHGKRYDYSKTKYRPNQKATITCTKHGDFVQNPHLHTQGSGCPTCGVAQMAKENKLPVSEFIKRLKEKWGKTFLLRHIQYQGISKKVGLECREHGLFFCRGHDLLKGAGCPKCSNRRTGQILRSSTEDFVQKANQVHKGKYNYTSSEYETSKSKVQIYCPIHGEFTQTANGHLGGHGCPSCGATESTQEKSLVGCLTPYFPDLITRDRSGIAGKGKKYNLELDIYIPSAKVAIEISGLYWHSSAMQQKGKSRKWVINHHLEKTRNCASNGVELLTFYEDEVNNKKEVVIASILSKCGVTSSKIFARKTKVEDINWQEAGLFLDNFHLQGRSKPGKTIGLKDQEGKLVAIMVLDKPKSIRGEKEANTLELIRYCSNAQVVGGASKLLKAFVRRNPEARKIISYSDRRISSGKMYNTLGFTCTKTSRPDYTYVVKGERKHKSNFTRAKLAKVLAHFDPELTEEENCFNHKLYKIFNCGLQKWELEV